MPPEDTTREGKESLPRTPSVVPSARVQKCLEALVEALEVEIGQILARAHDFDRVYKELLAEVVTLRKSRTARLLDMSLANLDRQVKSGQIDAIYTDSHPRFKLTEINRYLKAREGKKRRGRRGSA